MENSTRADTTPGLRVLLAGANNVASVALTSWLWEQGGLVVAGPATDAAGVPTLATAFRPEVVLLDFHRLPDYLGYPLSFFKALRPAPMVFVLAHETSDTMRRRCLALGADAVFHKTGELPQLAAALDALRHAAHPGNSAPAAP